jgi:hypothetical protein
MFKISQKGNQGFFLPGSFELETAVIFRKGQSRFDGRKGHSIYHRHHDDYSDFKTISNGCLPEPFLFLFAIKEEQIRINSNQKRSNEPRNSFQRLQIGKIDPY